MTEADRSRLVRPGERLDDLQRGGYHIIQDPGRFCFGMDAVLLADFARALPGEKVLDLGSGNGIIPLLMHARTPQAVFTGLEIAERNVDLAGRSIAWNHLEGQVRVLQGDIREPTGIFPAASFDVVTTNPPYMTADHGLLNADPEKAAARHEVLCSLEDVVSAAAALVRPGGRVYMVHRPFRLSEILCMLTKYRLEPKELRLVHPFADREPNMVLLYACKGGRSRLKVDPPLIVYEKPGVYTREVLDIYGKSRGGGET